MNYTSLFIVMGALVIAAFLLYPLWIMPLMRWNHNRNVHTEGGFWNFKRLGHLTFDIEDLRRAQLVRTEDCLKHDYANPDALPLSSELFARYWPELSSLPLSSISIGESIEFDRMFDLWVQDVVGYFEPKPTDFIVRADDEHDGPPDCADDTRFALKA